MNKAFWKSKILWTNLAGILIIAYPPAKEVIEKILEPESLMIIGNLTTIFFRLLFTKTNLVIR